MQLSQLLWDTHCLRNNQAVRNESFGIPSKAKKVRFPIRLLRYWFMHHFLCEESIALGRPISICEIGVDSGQMKRFTDSTHPDPCYTRWQAVDCHIQKEALLKSGYDEFLETDIESDDFALEENFDAMILLHVLEHLKNPEEVVEKLAHSLKKGGIMIGGFPVTPHCFAAKRERKLRRTAGTRGHISVFSPRRVREMAKNCRMTVEFLSGAFFMRKQGFFLENTRCWLHFNLLFGALFPSWPGEIYWKLRKD